MHNLLGMLKLVRTFGAELQKRIENRKKTRVGFTNSNYRHDQLYLYKFMYIKWS